MYRQLSILGLRGFTQIFRLILVVLLAKFLSPEDLGLYGLFFAFISYCVMLVGLDLYAIANRQAVNATTSIRRHILENQLTVYICGYLLVIPASALLFQSGVLPWEFFLFFAALLVVEHLSYEVYRLLSVLGRPGAAGVVAFIRSASWVPLLVILFITDDSKQSLTVTYLLWFLGCSASILFAGILLYQDGIAVRRFGRDTQWIKKSIRAAVPFIIGTLAVRATFTLDRFLVEEFSGLQIVGVYTFYVGIAGSMLGMLEASIFNFNYPKLIAFANQRNIGRYLKELGSMATQTAIGVVVIAGIITYFAPYLIQLIDRPIYLEHIELLNLILAAFGLYCLSLVPHFGLFALKSDKTLMVVHIIGMLIFVLSAYFFYNASAGTRIVPYALIATFSAILLMKVLMLAYRFSQYKAAGPINV